MPLLGLFVKATFMYASVFSMPLLFQSRNENDSTLSLCHLTITALLHSELQPTNYFTNTISSHCQPRSVMFLLYFADTSPKDESLSHVFIDVLHYRIFPPTEARRSSIKIPVQCVTFVDTEDEVQKADVIGPTSQSWTETSLKPEATPADSVFSRPLSGIFLTK